MFRASLNRARISLQLETRSPLRVGAGDVPFSAAAADVASVRTTHPDFGASVYVPGTSLKGVLRSSAEQRLRERALAPEGLRAVCDPLRAACTGALAHRRLSSAEVHREHCPCCRLFGSAALRARLRVCDQFPWPAAGAPDDAARANAERANRGELRQRLGIDRRTGTVSAGPFESEVVPAGVSFHGEILLENYQVWQLGLLASALDDLGDGFAQLGAGKSEGLGWVRARVESIAHEQCGPAERAPAGVGALVSAQQSQAYGLVTEGELPAAPGEPRGLASRYSVSDGAAIDAWLDAGRQALGALLR